MPVPMPWHRTQRVAEGGQGCRADPDGVILRQGAAPFGFEQRVQIAPAATERQSDEMRLGNRMAKRREGGQFGPPGDQLAIDQNTVAIEDDEAVAAAHYHILTSPGESVLNEPNP